MKRADVLFIASDYRPKPGGRADYIDNLARGLIENGRDARVVAVMAAGNKERRAFLESYEEWVSPFEITYDERPKGWLFNKVASGLEIVRCTSPKAQRLAERTGLFEASRQSVLKLKQVLTLHRPAMVVFGHSDVRLYPLALYLREHEIPYGIIVHGLECPYCPNRMNECVRRGAMLRGAKWIAANSQYTRTLLDAWKLPAGTVRVLYPPIADEVIRFRADSEPLQAGSNGITLVTLCRVVSGKGIDIVLRAIKILSRRGIQCRYIVGGDGDQRESLERLADELGVSGNVKFVGAVAGKDKLKLLQQGDVYVMPSRVEATWAEGFGIAFIEAAALGLPAIGSRTGGIPDAIIDGETGILVREESPEELADAVARLYQNPVKAREMGKLGMERARSQFSPAAIASRFEEEVLPPVCEAPKNSSSKVVSLT